MKIAVLGTGNVGKTIAAKLNSLGHDVYMGTRDTQQTLSRPAPNAKSQDFATWLSDQPRVVLCAFGDIPQDIELFVNATNGNASAEALSLVGASKLDGKVVLDLSNGFDYSNGMPPALSVCNTTSLVETLQEQFPGAQFVKSLNTMNCSVMMNPGLVPGDHNVFVSGTDQAKRPVINLLQEIGWAAQNIIDLGDLSTARGTEMLLPIWLRLYGKLGTATFNFNVVKG
mgnify:CR=1 FL=1|jgi:8-hydroxy-5-deazaflavin:NADPH oxidoreductase